MADIYGRNPVRAALRGNADINRITIARGARHGIIDEIYDLAKEAGVPVSVVERKVLDRKFPGENHQGVAANLAEASYVTLETLFERATEKNEDPLFIVCDEIEDPHNLGAIMRNADAFGAHGVIIPRRRSAALSEGAVKSAAGAAQHVGVARVSNIVQTLKLLKQKGIWICGTAADGASMYESRLDGPLAIVIGNESKGMGRLVRESCDFVTSIPSGGHVGSLNAAVASGIVLCEVRRQRGTHL